MCSNKMAGQEETQWTSGLRPLLEADRNGVPGLLADPGSDVLAQAQDMARGAHPHQTAVVAHAVEGGVDLDPTFAEFLPDVKGDLHIGAVDVGDLPEHGSKFVDFG